MNNDAQTVQKVKELLGVPADEPIFILRAQDKFSVLAIEDYILDTCDKQPIGREGLAEWRNDVMSIRNDFRDWQRDNPDKVKVPD